MDWDGFPTLWLYSRPILIHRLSRELLWCKGLVSQEFLRREMAAVGMKKHQIHTSPIHVHYQLCNVARQATLMVLKNSSPLPARSWAASSETCFK